MYPAEKLMAEHKTTTPALMTQVIIVGLTGVVDSIMLERRLFFEGTLRSFGELDRRFALARAGSAVTVGSRRRPGGPTEGSVSGY